MWRIPYLLLIVGSVVAGLLLVERIILSHAIHRERRVLATSQQEVANGPSYENAWKRLAAGIYRASSHDAALVELLKRHDIAIHVAPPSPVQASSESQASSKPVGVPSPSRPSVAP